MNGEDRSVEITDVDGVEAAGHADDEGARHAVARGRVTMQAETAASVTANTLKKGDVLATARYAAVQAAKQTSSLIAGADTVTLTDVTIRFVVGETWIDIEARVECVDRVDIEAHALSAVTIAALTVYDMCKSADRTMMIGAVELFETSGRGLGLWRRGEDDPDGEI
jgi:cyclic pyranopterin phosphate synthase